MSKQADHQKQNRSCPLASETSDKQQREQDGRLSRRDFLRSAGLGAAAIGVASGCQRGSFTDEELSHLEGKRLGMVIDLQRCTGCGACNIACKSENNLREGHYWSHHITTTNGTFPNVRYEYLPTLCNHCDNAPCAKACPTSALHHTAGGVVAHDADKCIGCRACIINCPYGEVHAHFGEPHSEWENTEELIEGVTGSPASTIEDTGGDRFPYYNNERAALGEGNRYHGIVEKCDFCLHRLKDGELPSCIEACPTDARIFGDLDDPGSSVSRVLGLYRPFRRQEHLGTEPKVQYVRSFNSASDYPQTKGELTSKTHNDAQEDEDDTIFSTESQKKQLFG
ncbi:4Fe-4S dicluster domain-containing protein [Natronogracilivirga saccharolytica]|uniref:4Fe-4S dicluster domain-containing protein n=1 Tax=Natronogracilivirga saccharolytica TaxID=2812953 RepID=A0A8J7UW64_9BACT|nr:4Fe-4S dicluster domain-containing protein [Natronogracilivirga saccharolytica]MBP3193292.1 4Fe-4S dicluster domain-containing protein [Natronogracilivirga saccharolytica]